MRKTVSDVLRETGHRWIDRLSINQLAAILLASAPPADQFRWGIFHLWSTDMKSHNR